MTLPNPGVSLSMSQIQTEFGGTNPASLSEYYAGGAYVPAGTTGTNGAIPSSSTISISDFYGAPLPEFTAGINQYLVFPSGPYYSYVGYGVSGALFPALGGQAAGTLVNGPFIIGATTYTISALFDRSTTSPTTNNTFFGVLGNKTGTWWTSVTVNGITYSRTGDFTGGSVTGVYDAASNTTYWQTPAVIGGLDFNLADTVSYTVKVVA
jgi:hypothetical protein